MPKPDGTGRWRGAKTEKDKLAVLDRYRAEQRKRDVPLVEDFPLHKEEETPEFRDLRFTLEIRMARAYEHWKGNQVTLAEMISELVGNKSAGVYSVA